MIPKSVSASALENARQCMAMYKASSIDRAGGGGNPAALLGTTLHDALDKYLVPSLMERGLWEWDLLFACYQAAYLTHFGYDTSSEWYSQGKDILYGWFTRPDQRHDIQSNKIISKEVKKSFPVPYKLDGHKFELPCNYIIDRLDRMADGSIRVVVYKSQRVPLNGDEIFKKIQPRLYALAIQIEYPEVTGVTVQYDFLRHERVGVTFTREDNGNTWRWLKRAVQDIIDAPEDFPPETINENCRYCVLKTTCKTLATNIWVGSVDSLDMDTLALTIKKLSDQEKGIKAAKEELEMHLLKYAAENDTLEWETDTNKIKVISRRTRTVNREAAAELLGPELMKEYGKLGVGEVDALRKSGNLTMEQASLLNSVFEYSYSSPSIKVIAK